MVIGIWAALVLPECALVMLSDMPVLARIAVVVFILLGVWAILAAALRWERRREAMFISPICPSCGYDLTGNQSGICPECGKSIR